MQLLCDHKTLIEELKSDKHRLTEDIKHLKIQMDSLIDVLKTLSANRVKAAQVMPSRTPAISEEQAKLVAWEQTPYSNPYEKVQR